MELRINPLVVDDLKQIRDFIREDSEKAAQETVEKIYGDFETIQQFPSIGAALSKRVSFKTDYRYLIHGNYIILYRLRKDNVEIYRVIARFQDLTGMIFS